MDKNKSERQEYQLITDLSDEEYDRMFPEGTRTPTQMKMRLRQVITTGLNNLHRFPGEGDENPVGPGGPFDFRFLGEPMTIHFDTPKVTPTMVALWRVFFEDGRVVDIRVPKEIENKVFVETSEPWVLFKEGDPHGVSKIMVMIPFEIVSLIQNLWTGE